jgi:tRNA (pseudouridine54-N1)-methyltransferase
MKLTFFIKSPTVNLDNFTIKDIPGSSGRLDVISRSILAAILTEGDFEANVKIWVFLDNFGTYIFDPELLNYGNFPKNELMLSELLVTFLLQSNLREIPHNNPLNRIKTSNLNMFKAIKKFQKNNYNIFILREDGNDFFKLKSEIQKMNNILFIIGSQKDNFLNSKELLALKIPAISIGNQSYLASSVIRLLKLHILLL